MTEIDNPLDNEQRLTDQYDTREEPSFVTQELNMNAINAARLARSVPRVPATPERALRQITANGAVIVTDGTRWALRLREAERAMVIAQNQQLRYTSRFGQSRQLPESGILTVEDVLQVIVGWNSARDAWQLGLVLSPVRAAGRDSSWCNVSSWTGNTERNQRRARAAGAALAQVLDVSFRMLERAADDEPTGRRRTSVITDRNMLSVDDAEAMDDAASAVTPPGESNETVIISTSPEMLIIQQQHEREDEMRARAELDWLDDGDDGDAGVVGVVGDPDSRVTMPEPVAADTDAEVVIIDEKHFAEPDFEATRPIVSGYDVPDEEERAYRDSNSGVPEDSSSIPVIRGYRDESLQSKTASFDVPPEPDLSGYEVPTEQHTGLYGSNVASGYDAVSDDDAVTGQSAGPDLSGYDVPAVSGSFGYRAADLATGGAGYADPADPAEAMYVDNPKGIDTADGDSDVSSSYNAEPGYGSSSYGAGSGYDVTDDDLVSDEPAPIIDDIYSDEPAVRRYSVREMAEQADTVYDEAVYDEAVYDEAVYDEAAAMTTGASAADNTDDADYPAESDSVSFIGPDGRIQPAERIEVDYSTMATGVNSATVAAATIGAAAIGAADDSTLNDVYLPSPDSDYVLTGSEPLLPDPIDSVVDAQPNIAATGSPSGAEPVVLNRPSGARTAPRATSSATAMDALAPLPINLGNWQLRLGKENEGDVVLVHSAQWRGQQLRKILWYSFWTVVYIVVSGLTIRSALALPISGTLIPRPDLLPYIGLAIAVILIIYVLYLIWQAFIAAPSFHIDRIDNTISAMRGRRRNWTLSGTQIQSVYVSEVVAKGDSTTEYGELNLHLMDGKFRYIIQQGEPLEFVRQPDIALPVKDVIIEIDATIVHTPMQQAAVWLSSTLGQHPVWYDRRVKKLIPFIG